MRITTTTNPHISAMHMVRRCDASTGREEKILVLETDVNLPQAGESCDDENLYAVLQHLATLRSDAEKIYGKFQMVEIRNVNDNHQTRH